MEFTTTACNRPELLERTYSSFTKNIKGLDFKKCILYINVDPSPHSQNIEKNEEVAKKYFGKVIVNYPDKPNFARAVIWCFTQVRGEYFFHLEDDWVLKKQVHMGQLIKYLRTIKDVHQCIFQKKYIFQPNEPALIPSVHRTAVAKLFLKQMNDKTNPEAQLKRIHKMTKRYKYLIYDVDMVVDIGRNWLKKNNIRRNYAQTGKNNTKWSPWITWDVGNYKKLTK